MASVSGMVIETSIQAYTVVSAGDILVQLDDRTESLNLQITQAKLDQAPQSVARYNSLSSSASATAVDVADAAVAARLAEAVLSVIDIAKFKKNNTDG